MKFWLPLLGCFIFVVWLDSRILEGNSMNKIRSAGKKEREQA